MSYTFTVTVRVLLLNIDKEILILPADKGNATVIISTTDYVRKIETLLYPITYNKLPRHPTARLLRTTNQLIKDSTTVAAEDISKFKKSEVLPPRLYGLPKIHKPLVVSSGTCTEDTIFVLKRWKFWIDNNVTILD